MPKSHHLLLKPCDNHLHHETMQLWFHWVSIPGPRLCQLGAHDEENSGFKVTALPVPSKHASWSQKPMAKGSRCVVPRLQYTHHRHRLCTGATARDDDSGVGVAVRVPRLHDRCLGSVTRHAVLTCCPVCHTRHGSPHISGPFSVMTSPRPVLTHCCIMVTA